MMTTKESASPAAATTGEDKNEKKVDLQVTLVNCDIVQAEAPVIAAGQYKGVAPIRAVGALDAALDYWISEAVNRSMVGGDLGELNFIPVFHDQIAARTILLAGMGEFGKFSYDALCYLAMNMAYGVSNFRLAKFASVLIGSGEGGLSLEEAAKGLLCGVCHALHHLPEERRFLKEFILVEKDLERYKQIKEAVNKFEHEKSNGKLNLKVVEGTDSVAKDIAPASPSRASAPPPITQFVNRITIERGEEGFQYSALTDTAVIPVRRVDVQSYFVEGIAERLKLINDEKRQERFGRLLHSYIFPEDFESHVSNQPLKPLTLILDSTTACLPWEMACFKTNNAGQQGAFRFGTDLKLTRQFRTMLSHAPGIAPPVNDSLKVLVIADPAPEKELQLEGARAEGEAVVKLLNELIPKFAAKKLTLEISERIGPQKCNPVDILDLVFDETFDVIHFCGHGIFNEEFPNRSGWVFGKNCIMSAREIFRTRRVPRLIFANACFTAVIKDSSRSKGKTVKMRKPTLAEETNRKLAGIAEAFFERGVENYIGTGWKVNDADAVKFATTFYEKALKGDLLGDAIAAAHNGIFRTDETYNSTWGAYQHYGQSNARLIR
ncbi:MAG TPA: CHAT domain-containing protein [Blastocatellia bacterium]|nr:CHAT domain-containing protein [Blastocatellia bacterium]